MPDVTIANIDFYRPENGGLKSPPFSHFAAPVRLRGRTDENTLLMDFIYILDRHRVAEVMFLTDEGPSEQLVKGCVFEILQGDEVIGKGIITNAKS